MRKDVANLLERLGKREFHYQEFADRFTDVELWPIFETLIRDPRILTMDPQAAADLTAARPETTLAAALAAPAAPTPAARPAEDDDLPGAGGPARPVATAPAAKPAAPATDLTALFARYGGGAAEDAPSDVRTLLQHLAQQIEQGKL